MAPTGPTAERSPSAQGDWREPQRLLVEHDAFLAGLGCRAQAKYLRRRGAERLLAAHPDLPAWMSRPVADRLVEARRLGAWPFLSWCFAIGAVVPELELLVGKARGIHFSTWARLHPGDVDRARRATRELGWCPEYEARVTVGALALVCLTRAVTLDTLSVADLDAVAATITGSPLIPTVTGKHLRAEHHSLRVLCYQLGVLDTPPEHGNARRVDLAERVAEIAQPRIREVVLRYLRTIATTLRPKSVEARAASLRGFAGWLATTHPDITTLAQLRRPHLEEFLIFHAGRVSHGRARHGLPISVRHHHRTVNDLRVFFDDLAAWGWADRPTGLLVHRADVPRLPAPLPRALSPDVDTALMAGV